MVLKLLDNLHDQFPGCETVAFADLSTLVILVTNSDTPHHREELDALCAEAAASFGPPQAPALGSTPAGMVFVATPDRLRIYLRDADEPDDALCCVCSHDIAIPQFLAAARACLEKISHGT